MKWEEQPREWDAWPYQIKREKWPRKGWLFSASVIDTAELGLGDFATLAQAKKACAAHAAERRAAACQSCRGTGIADGTHGRGDCYKCGGDGLNHVAKLKRQIASLCE